MCNFVITQFCGNNIIKVYNKHWKYAKVMPTAGFKSNCLLFCLLLDFLLQALLYVYSKSSRAYRATRLWSFLQRANVLNCTLVACGKLLPIRQCIATQVVKALQSLGIQTKRSLDIRPVWQQSFCILVVQIRSTFRASTAYCRKQWDIFSLTLQTHQM